MNNNHARAVAGINQVHTVGPPVCGFHVRWSGGPTIIQFFTRDLSIHRFGDLWGPGINPLWIRGMTVYVINAFWNSTCHVVANNKWELLWRFSFFRTENNTAFASSYLKGDSFPQAQPLWKYPLISCLFFLIHYHSTIVLTYSLQPPQSPCPNTLLGLGPYSLPPHYTGYKLSDLLGLNWPMCKREA